MGNAAMTISPLQNENLCRYIHKRTGIHLHDHQMNLLRQTVTSACEKFGYDYCDDYFSVLEESSATSPELEYLIAGITVGETYFFRDEEQINYLRTQWLPRLLDEKQRAGNKQLRIWSAGCASGEELYSMTILITEALGKQHDWNIQLLGTDINVRDLAKAVEGRYKQWSLRATSNYMRSKYFSTEDQEYIIKPELQVQTKFAYLNLVQDNLPTILSGTNNLDLILCRNVFIYFTDDVIRQVMEKFRNCLNTDGILMVGPTDLLQRSPSRFRYQQVDDVGFYQRDEKPSVSQPVKPPQQQSVPVSGYSSGRSLKQQQPIRPTSKPKTLNKGTSSGKPKTTVGKAEIIKYLHDGKWQEALATIQLTIADTGNTALLYQWQSKIYANLGDLNQALEHCQQSLTLNGTEKHSHFLHGMIMIGLGQCDAAIAAMRKTLYLDHRFIEAHFQLGLLLLECGQREAGLKSLNNALDLAETCKPTLYVHDAPGLTFGRLAEILRQEIDLYAHQMTGANK